MRYEPEVAEHGMATPAPDRGQSEFYFAAWRRTFDFTGVASRTEYWSFVLVNFAIYWVLFAILFLSGLPDSTVALVSVLYWITLLVPYLSVSTRRMRDATDRGWFILLGLIPVVGLVPVLGIALFPARDQQQLDRLGIRYRDVWRKSADYLSDSNRDEFWTFTLINLALLFGGVVVFFVIAFIADGAPRAVAQAIIFPPLAVLGAFCVALIVPLTSLTVRRVRSATGSGWWSLIGLIPYLGLLVVLVLVLLPGPGSERFKPSENRSVTSDDGPRRFDPDDPWNAQRPGTTGQ